MTRILVLILLLVLLYLAIRRLVAGFRAGYREGAGAPRPGSPGAVTRGRLLRCARCGVRFPQDRRIERAGESYCSSECARRGAAPDPR